MPKKILYVSNNITTNSPVTCKVCIIITGNEVMKVVF